MILTTKKGNTKITKSSLYFSGHFGYVKQIGGPETYTLLMIQMSVVLAAALALRYTSQKFFHRYYITKVGAPLMS
jgi:hypothetical protein